MFANSGGDVSNLTAAGNLTGQYSHTGYGIARSLDLVGGQRTIGNIVVGNVDHFGGNNPLIHHASVASPGTNYGFMQGSGGSTYLNGASVTIRVADQDRLKVDSGGNLIATFANKPTVTGSRGGNAALASLLTALAGYGLIVDSTS